MNTKRIVGILLSSTALLFSPAVIAQEEEEDLFTLDEGSVETPKPIYTSEIEIGAAWASEDSFKFGEFSGIKDKGAFITGNFRIQRRDPYDGDGAEYWTLTGTNLGLASRSLGFEYGHQGSFAIRASYDQIPKFLFDDARTPYELQGGGTNLVLPAGWIPSDRNVTLLPNLDANLQDVNIGHNRKKFGGGFTWNFYKNWKLKSDFSRELKEGTRTIAAIFGSNGGNPAGALVPDPVDYETDNFDLAISYAGKKSQFALAYNLSVFRDNLTSLTFDNPFDSTRYSADVNFPNGRGRLALPPDNKAHRISLSGGYRFNSTTRATAHIAIGRMKQNDAFLPFTVNPALLVTTPLPRASLNGKINTTLARINVTARPSPKLNLRVSYKFNDRDNNTPRDVYIYVPGDTANQGDISGSTARINLPYSRKQNLFELDAGYRLTGDIRLSAGYDYEQLERTFSEVTKTKEHKLNAKLRATISSDLSGWVGVDYGSRTGSDYVHNAPFLASHTPEHLGPDPEDEFENHPLVRKFFIADRDRVKFAGTVNWMPSDKSAISVMGRHVTDDYNDTVVGLTGSTSSSVTVDASYNVTDTVTYHAYYTYENYEYEQAGFANRRGTDLTDFAAQAWSADTGDKINTFGLGFEWVAIKDELDVTFDYNYSSSKTGFDLTGGTAISFEPLPDLKNKLHMVQLKADYQYSDHLWLRFRYLFQNFDVTDFALDGVNPDSMGFIIGLGNQSPDYTVHVLGVSTIYRF